ncbi:MAG: methyltransferase domain-containing protein [Alphaproteobacteria bacterium]|nr:methyltransferase domain-containing protein [Alphaproteobacteria bacterium]
MTSKCWQISFFPKNEPSPEFIDFLESFFEVTAQNYSDDGNDEYIGYQSTFFDEQQMLIIATNKGISLPPYQISELKSENWLKDYVIEFPSFEIADFCIYGIHEKQQPTTKKITLQIYAATAFGSNHQTTQSCIKALSELKQTGFSAQNILDIGTGSGILSLCSAKLWPNAQILASDIDEEAVVVTDSNAQTNNLHNQINTIQSNGYQNNIIAKSSPYDLILSNILANPLITFSSSLSQNLISGGYCILSGFVDDQVDDVISAHQKHNLKLIKLYSHDNWRTALMQKD